MGALWPDDVDPAPGVIARAGRVVHWAGVLIGAIPGAIGVAYVLFGNRATWDEVPIAALFFGLWFALCAIAGRGLRYILAGE